MPWDIQAPKGLRYAGFHSRKKVKALNNQVWQYTQAPVSWVSYPEA